MNKILVTYATRAGSTVEVAQAIGEVLKDAGAMVEVKPIKQSPDPGRYDVVVIGSAIRMGAWLPEAVDFVKQNQARLKEIPTAFFTVHVLNRDESVKSLQAREAYTAPVREIVSPDIEVFFSGKMDYARLSFLDRLIAKSVAQSTNSGEGDYRDWEAIHAWAQNLTTKLIPA